MLTSMTANSGSSKLTISRTAAHGTLALAILLVLAACQGTAPAGDRAARLTTAAPSVGPGSGGPGSITLSLTQPAVVEGHVTTPVTCSAGHAYEASASSAVVQGYGVSFSVRAAPYSGPGEYATVVTVTLVEPNGTTISVPAVPGAPASISATGGTFSMSATGSNGRSVALALTWACST